MRTNVPRAICHLRRDRGWTQEQLGHRAGISRAAVSRIERGLVTATTVGTLDAVIRALGAALSVQVQWHGERLDRLMDAAHAELQERVAQLLASAGWIVHVEVSFNRYGDRGRIDVFAVHPALRIALVIEIKTGIGDIQETVGRLDVKARVARTVARDLGIGELAAVVPALVLANSRPTRAVVARHAAIFERFSLRGRAARSWIRHPSGTLPRGLLWFAAPGED